MSDEIHTRDLQGANETLTLLVTTLRELRAQGVNPSPEECVKACLDDDSDPMVALARVSLLLTVALNRLVDQ